MRFVALLAALLAAPVAQAQTPPPLSLDDMANALNLTAECTAVYMRLRPLMAMAAMGAQTQRDQALMIAAVKENEAMIKQYRDTAQRIMARNARGLGLDSDKLNVTHEAMINQRVENSKAPPSEDEIDVLFLAAGTCKEMLPPFRAKMQIPPG